MKRLFGLTGITFLLVLTAVFYFGSGILISVLGFIGVAALAVGIALIAIKKNSLKNKGKSLIIFSVALLLACLDIILYANIAFLPVVEKYSSKEITASGYICDEVINTDSKSTFTVETYTVDGKEEKIKIQVTSYDCLFVEAFDKVDITANVSPSKSNSLISKGIYFKSYADDDFSIKATGDREQNLYSLAVGVRTAMKNALDSVLPEDCSSLCKAVLLGDKLALDSEITDDFSLTGTSFLIVVSGMHLVIISSFVLFFVKKITHLKLIRSIAVIICVLLFVSITGFTPSVVRAGVMMSVTALAAADLRAADSLNSLGLAALVLTVLNPFSVADVGMLLSFAATAGIILWSKPISAAVLKPLKLGDSVLLDISVEAGLPERTVSRFVFCLKRSVIYVTEMFSVSLAAFLWVLPITVMSFHTISPLVIFISLFAEPLVSLLLVFSFLTAVMYLCPAVSVLSYSFGIAAGVLARITLALISFASELPYSLVITDEPYFFLWTGFGVALAVFGVFVKNKRLYVKLSAAACLSVLVLGYSVTALLDSDRAELKIYNSGTGTAAAVMCRGGTSIISCGGNVYSADDIIDDIAENGNTIDCVVIPGTKSKYSSLQPMLISSFDLNNILIYDDDVENQKLVTAYDGESRQTFGGDTSFALNFSDEVTDDVICIDGSVFQYVRGRGLSVLFVTSGSDVALLPEKYRNPDYILLDSVPCNADLVSCEAAIFSGTESQLSKKYNDLKEIYGVVYSTAESDITLDLRGE